MGGGEGLLTLPGTVLVISNGRLTNQGPAQADGSIRITSVLLSVCVKRLCLSVQPDKIPCYRYAVT